MKELTMVCYGEDCQEEWLDGHVSDLHLDELYPDGYVAYDFSIDENGYIIEETFNCGSDNGKKFELVWKGIL